MQSIEAAYPTLEGVLTKFKYDIIPHNTLAALVAIFNRPALKTATGDVIGSVYEYFLNEFARLEAQGGGAFFTLPALVRTIVGVIEPQRGRVLDPACGSAGIFVQTAHFFKRHHPGPRHQPRLHLLRPRKNPHQHRLVQAEHDRSRLRCLQHQNG